MYKPLSVGIDLLEFMLNLAKYYAGTKSGVELPGHCPTRKKGMVHKTSFKLASPATELHCAIAIIVIPDRCI